MRFPFYKKYKPAKDPIGNFKNGIYFIHIPKTGGTSIAKILGLKDYSHIKAWEVKASGNYNLLEENFSFSVVRNPFDRFISLYNYARLDISYYHDNLVEPENEYFPRHLDYKLLKESTIQECVNYLVNNQLKHDLEWNQWQPQFNWIFEKNKKKQLVKKIYKLENLDSLKNDLNDLGFELKDFPVLNFSKKSNYKELIDLKSRKILEEFYKKDLEYFNYQF